jgi:hypothetical protein
MNETTPLSHINYLSLGVRFSLTNGKVTFPRIRLACEVRITGDELAANLDKRMKYA